MPKNTLRSMKRRTWTQTEVPPMANEQLLNLNKSQEITLGGKATEGFWEAAAPKPSLKRL